MELSAELYPRLTTVRVDRHAMGRRAVQQILARLAGDESVPTITGFGYEIVDRESA